MTTRSNCAHRSGPFGLLQESLGLTSITALTISALLVACGDKKPVTPPTVEATIATLQSVGLDPAALDKTTDPCTDFYQFTCGGWIAANELPADKPQINRFSEIFDRGEAELRSILDELKTKPNLTAELLAVRDFYGSCMDEAAAEAAGTKPLEPLLDAIKGVRNRQDLSNVVGLLHNHGIWVGFRLGADADFKDAKQTIGQLEQSGLGLPDRDYYTSDKPEMNELRTAYSLHIGRMLSLAGWSAKDAADGAMAVTIIETRLAEKSKTRVERRDIPNMYNKIDRAGIETLAPRFDWKRYFGVRGAAEFDGINVSAPEFVKQFGSEVETTSLQNWKHYLSWHVVRALAPRLSKAFNDEAFTMTSKLSGQKEQRPRWKRCLSATNGALGDSLAVPFIERMFPGASKSSAIAMIEQISSAFSGALAEIPWMSAETKAKAAEKRSQMSFLIGYPDKLKQYDFPVTPSDYASNTLAAWKWEQRRVFAKAGKPTDLAEWYMLPQTVNAYYNPLTNQMAFPAGILQPPFFGVNASASVNLGGMGMIVGHELTHGFDDQGSQFAGDGNMRNWWQPEDLAQFKGKSECVVAQYENYEPLQGKKVNGDLTLGENIADIGGVKLAFQAHRALLDRGTPTMADGYTDDQQFFIAVGQAWCAKQTDELTLERLVTDPHSPAKFRVNGSMVNQPEFAEAFACEANKPMNPANRCEVW